MGIGDGVSNVHCQILLTAASCSWPVLPGGGGYGGLQGQQVRGDQITQDEQVSQGLPA